MAASQTVGAYAQEEKTYISFNPINVTTVTKQKRLTVVYQDPTFPRGVIPTPAQLATAANLADADLNTLLDTGWRILKDSNPVVTKIGTTIVYTLVKLT